ncbi:MAG: class C sortase [Actinomycetia bacterium]|nr:class C sortase [Actinomycetes bacterium]
MADVQKKSGKLRLMIAALLAVIGAAVLLYPTGANLVYNYQVSQQQQAFLAATNQATARNPLLDELYDYLLQQNEQLFQSGQAGLVDAFSVETAGVDLSRYGLQDGCIGFVSIPKINITLPIYLGANSENLKRGATQLTQTSYPIGGTNTNAVIAAHRTIVQDMFRHLDELAPGDEVIITNFREELHYQVVGSRIIEPNDIQKIEIQPGRDMITLISCDPPGSTARRIVVYCERIVEN